MVGQVVQTKSSSHWSADLSTALNASITKETVTGRILTSDRSFIQPGPDSQTSISQSFTSASEMQLAKPTGLVSQFTASQPPAGGTSNKGLPTSVTVDVHQHSVAGSCWDNPTKLLPHRRLVSVTI